MLSKRVIAIQPPNEWSAKTVANSHPARRPVPNQSRRTAGGLGVSPNQPLEGGRAGSKTLGIQRAEAAVALLSTPISHCPFLIRRQTSLPPTVPGAAVHTETARMT